jgi:hypothetical protein
LRSLIIAAGQLAHRPFGSHGAGSELADEELIVANALAKWLTVTSAHIRAGSDPLTFLARVKASLAPCGYLIVNEIVRSEPSAPDLEWDKRYPTCLPLSEIIAILSDCGKVGVMRRASSWRTADNPALFTAVEIGSDSFFVVSNCRS